MGKLRGVRAAACMYISRYALKGFRMDWHGMAENGMDGWMVHWVVALGLGLRWTFLSGCWASSTVLFI